MTRTELWFAGFLPLGSLGVDILGEARLCTWWRRRGGSTELVFLEPSGLVYDVWAWKTRRMPRRLRETYLGMGFTGGLPDRQRFLGLRRWLLRLLAPAIRVSIRDETTGLYHLINAKSDALRRRRQP